MVQQATSTTEAPEASPDLSGDEPLIPPDPPENPQDMLIPPEGPAALEGTGDDADKEGDAEKPGEGAAPEPEKQEPEDEDEKEEPKARIRSDEEFKKLQSSYDRKVDELTKQVQQLQQQTSQSTIAAQVQAYQNQIAQELLRNGHSEDEAGRLAQQQAQLAKAAYENWTERQRIEGELKAEREARDRTAQSTLARDFAIRHGVPENKLSLLLSANSHEAMEALAKELGTLYKHSQQRAEQRQQEVPPEGPSQTYDNAEGNSGQTDDDWIRNVYAPGLSNDHARAQEIQRRKGFM